MRKLLAVVAILLAGVAMAWVSQRGADRSTVTVVPGAAPRFAAESTPVSAPAPTAAPTTTFPAEPPARICGNADFLTGPSTAPAGAVVVPAGDNSAILKRGDSAVYWLAPGVHTLGDGQYSQIQPQDGATFIGAPGAILDGRNINLYAFTTQARNVTIKYLTIRNFGTGTSNNNEGVVNHDAGQGWRVTNNTIEDNDGAGLFVGSDNYVVDNCLRNNGQYGFSAFRNEGVRNVTIHHNEIAGNNTDNWEKRIEGCGCTGGAKFWDTTGAVVTDNYIHDNRSVGLWADTNNVDFRIEGNWFESNDAEALFYEISYNAVIRYNTFRRNNLVKGRGFAKRGDNFPVATVYLSEAGGDRRVTPNFRRLEIAYNDFSNNWGGVTLWENADRFCNSPANTSGGYCTKLPGASFDTCVAGTIDDKPHYNDCRWKTRNVWVHHNQFRLNKAAIRCSDDYCARNAIISNYGTYPAWSPYKGARIQNAITFKQNNVFSDNRYVGDWKFMPFDTGHTMGFAEWRAVPYNQDASSTIE